MVLSQITKYEPIKDKQIPSLGTCVVIFIDGATMEIGTMDFQCEWQNI